MKNNKKSFLTKKVLCFKSKKFLNKVNPISKQLYNRIPLYSIFTLSIFIDFIFSFAFATLSYIIGGLMYTLAIILTISIVYDVLIILQVHTKISIIKYFFVIRLYLNIIINSISYILSCKYNVMEQMTIISVICVYIENIIILFIVWSAEKRKIIVDELCKSNQ